MERVQMPDKPSRNKNAPAISQGAPDLKSKDCCWSGSQGPIAKKTPRVQPLPPDLARMGRGGSRLLPLQHERISDDRVRQNSPARRRVTLPELRFTKRLFAIDDAELEVGSSYFLHETDDGTELHLRREPPELERRTHCVSVVAIEHGVLVEEITIRTIKGDASNFFCPPREMPGCSPKRSASFIASS